MTEADEFEQRMQAIRRRFIDKLDSNLPLFKEFHSNLKNGDSNLNNLEDIRMHVHKLAGSAQVFGFESVSHQANEIQNHLDQLISEKNTNHPYTELISKLDSFLLELEKVTTTKT